MNGSNTRRLTWSLLVYTWKTVCCLVCFYIYYFCLPVITLRFLCRNRFNIASWQVMVTLSKKDQWIHTFAVILLTDLLNRWRMCLWWLTLLIWISSAQSTNSNKFKCHPCYTQASYIEEQDTQFPFIFHRFFKKQGTVKCAWI